MRQLNDAYQRLAHNAWDNAMLPADKLEAAKEKIKNDLKSIGLNKTGEISNSDWETFYQKHQSSFFNDRKWILKHFPSIVDHESVFEFGCGVGNSLAMLHNYNKEIKLAGCDFSTTSIKLCIERIREGYFFIHDITKCLLGENRLDVNYSNVGENRVYLKQGEKEAVESSDVIRSLVKNKHSTTFQTAKFSIYSSDYKTSGARAVITDTTVDITSDTSVDITSGIAHYKLADTLIDTTSVDLSYMSSVIQDNTQVQIAIKTPSNSLLSGSYIENIKTNSMSHMSTSSKTQVTEKSTSSRLIDTNQLRKTPPLLKTNLISRYSACLLIFTLSAIHPDSHLNVLNNIKLVLKKGGLLYFNDYCIYDMIQLRYKSTSIVSDSFYRRSDGTFTYFFEINKFRKFMEDNLFEVIQLEEINQLLVNRKKNLDMYRRFLRGVFRLKT
ncbi:Methyltransferase-like protein [Cucumispora dikerogammari]|nr:Methyltransferase-like protein [Cucumispora dikerogammari]